MKQVGTEPCMCDGGQVSIFHFLLQSVPHLHTIKWLSEGFFKCNIVNIVQIDFIMQLSKRINASRDTDSLSAS